MSKTSSSTRSRAELAPIPWSLWGYSAIIVLGSFTSMLSSTIVGPAMPTIARNLASSTATVQWTTTGYLLALAAGVPISGWAARRIGTTRLWLLSLALFSVFSIWCALSPTIELLVTGRVLQGLAGGLLVPAGQTLLTVVAGRERLGRVLSTTGIAIVIAPTLGTTLGSIVLNASGWPWLFWLNIPLCVAALALGAKWLPRTTARDAGRLDWIGLALVLSGLPLLIAGASAIGQARGLGSITADLTTAAGAALLTAFILWSLRARFPLLQLRLFRNRIFAAGAAVMFLGGAINFGAQAILPLYFIQVHHETLLAAGLIIAPQVVGTAIGFPLAGRLADRYGAGLLLLAGGTITALATIPLAFARTGTGYLWLGGVLLVRGFGVALSTIPAMTASLASVTPDQTPDAAPILNLLQRTGAAIGTAVIAVLYSSHLTATPDPATAAAAFRYANWWLVAAACLLTLPAYLLTRAEHEDGVPVTAAGTSPTDNNERPSTSAASLG